MSHLHDAATPLWGEVRAAASLARHWKNDRVSSDNGVAFPVYLTTVHVYAAGIAGEFVWRSVTLEVGHTLGATLRFTPIVDGSSADVVIPFGVLRPIPLTFALPQQAAGAELHKVNVVLPCVRAAIVNGVERARWYLRGQAQAFKVEALGVLGTGLLQFEAASAEIDDVARASFAVAVVS